MFKDVIVTANNRQRFAMREACRKQNVPYPHIMTWDMWINELWAQYAPNHYQEKSIPAILTSLEIRELWESLITRWNNEQDEHEQLINPDAVAKYVSQGVEKTILYGIKKENLTLNTIEQKHFLVWYETMEARLNTVRALLPCQQQAMVTQWICDNAIQASNISFYGFAYPNALQKRVFEHLAQTGHADIRTMPPKTASIETKSFQTREDEITACANWARQKMEEDKTQTIGILVPELVRYHADVLRIFDNTLIPSSMFRPLENNQRPYRISLGTPVTERPLVKTLLSLLFMSPGKQMAFDDISVLLRNPFIGGFKEEFIRRAKLEAKFRAESGTLVSWQYVNKLINLHMLNGEECNHWCEDFASRWNAFTELYELWPKKEQTLPDVVNFIKRTYDVWGLSERAAMSNTDTEIAEHLFDDEKGWFSNFSSLNHEKNTYTLQQGLHKLHTLLKEVNFQPASGQGTITILSEYEAADLPFDAVWVMGLTNDAWPQAPSPNPFIDKQLQTDYSVPHASFQQEHDYAQEMTQRIKQQANQVTFSCPLSDEGRMKMPSHLIAENDTLEAEADISDPYTQYSQEMQALSTRHLVLDEYAPVFAKDKKAEGGTSLLRDQAQCPFRAFVSHRLGVKELKAQEVGLSASIRGEVLHECLDKFWRQVKNHESLCKLVEENKLNRVVSDVIHQSMDFYRTRYPEIFTDAIVRVEHDRLLPAISHWMSAYEHQREPFEKVITEQKKNIDINGLLLAVKVDHLDTTISDGTINIADNKSGEASTTVWFNEERLLEPQVPLYARILSEAKENVGSVVFKSFKSGKMGNKGIAATEGVAKGVKPVGNDKVNEVINTWTVQIDALAEEFLKGDARVAPYQQEKTCTYCPHASTCRVSEAGDQMEGSLYQSA